jgi:hypothetical protein
MGNTVVAIFEDIASAQQAETYLLEQGFNRADINLKTAVYKKKAEEDDRSDQQLDMFDSVKAFFADIFGNEEDASNYHLPSRNRTIVTVHTIIDDDAEVVANILDRYGALHIDSPGFSDGDEDAVRKLASTIKSRIVRHSVEKQKNNYA